ncbi:ABC transporter DrrB family efflux protein [Williamsia muralis]|nr:ABC transporter permease [Williamsia marianensis]PVY26684.1 ABC transporter DrrB family efflux protein [Williamsia marianensis]
MRESTSTLTVAMPPPRKRGAAELMVDCRVVAVRNLRVLVRMPQMVLGMVLQPLMFVLLFSYVFGEALGGDRYREFLIGGIMTQSVAFNAGFTALGVATELNRGIIDRFLLLPMSRLAIVVGRTLSDVAVNVVSLSVMSLTGLAIGWRLHGSFWSIVGGYLIVLLFGFAMSWVGTVIGLISASAEAAQSLMASILFPLSFISSAFVPAQTLPTPLRIIANWNPVTSVAQSLRESFGNPTSVNPLLPEPVTWASEHAHLYSVLACVVILAVAVPAAALVLNRSQR